MNAVDADRAFQSAKASRDRERRKKVFLYLETRWRNAAPSPAALKPFSDLWADVEAQRGGEGNPEEDDFWRQVVRSILEGFFDDERELFLITDARTRITSSSAMMRETLRWNEKDWWLLRALVRDSWASIETLCAWAWNHRYEAPRSWQQVLPPATPIENIPDPLDSISKRKVRITAKALRYLELSEDMSAARRLDEINRHLREHEDGTTVSRHTLEEARKSLAKISAQNCPKLP